MSAAGSVDFVEVLVVGERGGRFDGVDADDGAAQALLVGPDLGGEVGQRRLAPELAAQLLAGGFELTALTADAARPCVLAQRVDHRATDATLGKGFELDTARLVEAVRGIDEADDAILDEIANIDGVGHRGRHATSELLDEGNAVHDAGGVGGGKLGAHQCVDLRDLLSQPKYQTAQHRSFRRNHGQGPCSKFNIWNTLQSSFRAVSALAHAPKRDKSSKH